MFRLSCLVMALCLILSSVVSYAQVFPESLQRSQEDIISREEQRRNELLDQLHHKSPPQKKGQEAQDSLVKTPEQVKLFRFSHIQLEGGQIFTVKRLSKITNPYLNKDLSLSDIDSIIRDLTNLYIKSGYTTTRIYLPEQNLQQGILRIIILESTIGKLELRKGEKKQEEPQYIFPGNSATIFNIRDFEQGIDQINRLKSYEATIDLQPGEQQGQTDAIVTSKIKKPLHTTFKMESNNGGARSTGIQQQNFSLRGEDYFDFYESIDLVARHDMGMNPSGKRNRGLSATIEVPYHYWTFRTVTDYYTYLQTIKTGYQPFYLTGNNRSNMLEVERIIHRDSDSKTGLSVSITQKAARNYINRIKIETNSRKLTIGSVRLFTSQRLLAGAVNFSVQYDRGLKTLGALKDKNTSANMPKAQFQRVKSDLSYMKPFQIGQQKFSYQIATHAMWSPDSLFSSEKQSVGGTHTVRGYWDQSLSGNVGAYIRQELVWQLPSVSQPPLNHAFSRPELYFGIDKGWIRNNSSSIDDSGQISGIGTGLRLKNEHAFGEIGFEKAFSQPDSMDKAERRVFLKFGLEF